MLFVGAFERQLDDKGRLALPAPFRERLGEYVYLAKGPGKSLNVVPQDTFEDEAEDMKRRHRAGELSLEEMRAVAYSAELVQLDKQGRVKVGEALRGYAELAVPGSVMVTGRFDRLEIWSTTRFERVDAAATDSIAGGA